MFQEVYLHRAQLIFALVFEIKVGDVLTLGRLKASGFNGKQVDVTGRKENGRWIVKIRSQGSAIQQERHIAVKGLNLLPYLE